MRIKMRNVGIDVYESPIHNVIATNAVNGAIPQRLKLKFPMISPHQSELKKSDRSVPLKSPLFQYVYRPRRKYKITEKSIKDKVIADYKGLIIRHPKLVGDFYYQYYSGYLPSNEERLAILDIQRDAGATILSDFEPDLEQSVDKFEAQILALRDDNKKYIPSPTLDIGMQTNGLFGKKLDKLFEHKFQRFSIIYRHILTRQYNWITLSQKLLQKHIWCNVVGIPQRFLSNTNTISLLTTPFLYGVHSTSLGYPIRGRKKNKNIKSEPKQKPSKYNFNSMTYRFDQVSNTSEPESRATSINQQIAELRVARKHIIRRTFYSKYVLSKSGLLESLNELP